MNQYLIICYGKEVLMPIPFVLFVIRIEDRIIVSHKLTCHKINLESFYQYHNSIYVLFIGKSKLWQIFLRDVFKYGKHPAIREATEKRRFHLT